MFQSSKSSKITLHKKLFAPVSITSALGSNAGSSTEPKATIPVLLPPVPDLEVEAQTKPQKQTQGLNVLAQSLNIIPSTPKLDLAAPSATIPIPTPTANITLQPNHHVTEPQAVQLQPQLNSNNIQVLPPSPPRSPFYSASSSSSTGTSSSQQISNHARNFPSTSTTISNFGSPPPSYTPFVTPSLSPQAHGHRFGDGNAFGNTNGHEYSNVNQYGNGNVNQYGYSSGYPSPSVSSSSLQLPDLVGEVLRLRDRLNLLESGSLSNERGDNRGGIRDRSANRNRRRRLEEESKDENENQEGVKRGTKRAKERWEEIEKYGLGYEDFLEEFYCDDEKEIRLELNEESFGEQLGLEFKFVEDEVCVEERRGKENYGYKNGDGRELQEETVTLLPSVFVGEGSRARLRAYSSPFSVSSGLRSSASFSSTPPTPFLTSASSSPSLCEKESTKESQPPHPKSGCHYLITAGSIQNITIIYPVTSLPQNMDALRKEKELIRNVLEGWNRGVLDKYGIHPTKRAYAAIIYPESQAPLPRKKLRIALSFTPIYPSPLCKASSNPTYQTPTNSEDITTDTNIYISTTNDSSSFSQSGSKGVMDYIRYKVKYGSQKAHERHDGILEAGRLRAALRCEVFKQEGDERVNKIGGGEKQWENEAVHLAWGDGENDGSKWKDEKKGSEVERGVQISVDTKEDIEGGWI
ncbi:hypothetical protein EAF04_001348 [Stromatinia cepivora]|nr:hypothetical protein EAF04_001348 [Stromatinia cepivora]